MVHRHKIPDVIEPADDISICIPLPNEKTYIAAFLFTLKQMTLDRFWEHTPGLEAITVRNVVLNRTLKPVLDRLALLEGCGTMDCLDVADCIDTSEAVQTAIMNFNDGAGTSNPDYLSPAGTENTTIINNRFPPAERTQEANEAPADCDLDEIWSGIYFMVQQLDTVGRDWLEQAVSSGDKWQRAASIAKNIPIIGSLASTALEQLAEVAQDLLNLYNAYSTEAALQEIACALFEQVCAECRYPSYDEIADYYGSNSTITGGNLAEISLKAMVDFLIGSSLAISQLAYHTIISMVLFTLWLGSTFVGLRGAKWVSIWLDNGEEYANDEWEVLCDGCANQVWCYEWDFTVSNGNMAVIDLFGNGGGAWTNGVGWQQTEHNTAGFLYRRISIKTNTFTSIASNITEWQWEGDYHYGHFDTNAATPAQFDFVVMRNSNNGIMYTTKASEAVVSSYSGDGVIKTKEGLKSQTGSYFVFQIYTSYDNLTPLTADGTVTIRRLRIKGTGTMPAFTGGASC